MKIYVVSYEYFSEINDEIFLYRILGVSKTLEGAKKIIEADLDYKKETLDNYGHEVSDDGAHTYWYSDFDKLYGEVITYYFIDPHDLKEES